MEDVQCIPLCQRGMKQKLLIYQTEMLILLIERIQKKKNYIDRLAQEKFGITKHIICPQKFKKVAIVGLSGIGKTELAVEFAYRYNHVYDFIGWVNAENIESLIRSYGNLLNAIGVSFSKETSCEQIIELVKHKLPDKMKTWLLIYNNVKDPKFLDNKTPLVSGHVLITSCNRDWKDRIELNVFQPNEAITYLSKMADIKNTSNTLEIVGDIAKRLDYLPLALSQAAKYICKTQIGFAEYLQKLQSNVRISSNNSLFNENDYIQVVGTTLWTTIDNLSVYNPMVKVVIYRCAFLDPNSIFLKLFDDKNLDKTKVDKALLSLDEYSILQRRAKILTIHRLVQKIIRLKMSKIEQERIIIGILDLFCADNNHDIYKFDNMSKKTIDNLNNLSRHALLLFDHIEEVNSTNKKMLLSSCKLRLRVASFFNHCHRAAEAEKLLEVSIIIVKKYDPSFQNIDAIYRNLFNSYMIQGKFEKVLEKIPNNQLSLADTAILHHKIGNLESAEKMYLLIITNESTESFYHGKLYNSALIRANLGMLYFKQEKLDLAKQYLLDALKEYKIISGVDLDIAQTYRKLGMVCFANHDIRQANENFKHAFDKFTGFGERYQSFIKDCEEKMNTCKILLKKPDNLEDIVIEYTPKTPICDSGTINYFSISESDNENIGLVVLMDGEESCFKTIKNILNMVCPMILVRIVAEGSTFAGSIILSNIDRNTFAASGLIFVTHNFVVHALTGMIFPVNILIGQYYGASRKKNITAVKRNEYLIKIGTVFQQGKMVAIICCVLPASLSFLLEPILVFFGQDPDVAKVVASYFKAYAWGIPITYWLKVSQRFCYGIDQQWISTLFSVVTMPVVVVGGCMLSFGLFGLPKLGAPGYAIAYALRDLCCVLCLDSYLLLFCRKKFIPYKLLSFWRDCDVTLNENLKMHLSELLRITYLGFWLVLDLGSELLSVTVLSLLAGTYGKDALAAQGMVSQYIIVTLIPLLAFQNSATSLISQYYGNDKYSILNRYIHMEILFGLGITCGCFIISITIPEYLSWPFRFLGNHSSPDALYQFNTLLPISMLGMSFEVVRFVYTGGVRGIADGVCDTLIPLLIGVTALWVFGLPFEISNVFVIDLGLKGIALARNSSLLVGAVGMGIRWYCKLKQIMASESIKKTKSPLCCSFFKRKLSSFDEKDSFINKQSMLIKKQSEEKRGRPTFWSRFCSFFKDWRSNNLQGNRSVLSSCSIM